MRKVSLIKDQGKFIALVTTENGNVSQTVKTEVSLAQAHAQISGLMNQRAEEVKRHTQTIADLDAEIAAWEDIINQFKTQN